VPRPVIASSSFEAIEVVNNRTFSPVHSGLPMLRRHILLSLVALFVALAHVSPASAQTADSVLARFARIEGLTLRFHEVKTIALLSSPIVTDGTIAYARPGRLARRSGSQTVLIDGTALRMSDGGREQRIDLASQPIVRSFVDSFVQLLAGDREALERSYTLSFSVDAGSWTLTLRPRAAPLTQFLTDIVFHGHGDDLQSMTMTEVSGDVTTTTFSDVDDHHHFTPAESARVFAVP
jgi:outer membrane lipoprotein-sorting protein